MIFLLGSITCCVLCSVLLGRRAAIYLAKSLEWCLFGIGNTFLSPCHVCACISRCQMMYFTHFVEPYRWIGLEQIQFDVIKNICQSGLWGIDSIKIVHTMRDPQIHFVTCMACTVLKKNVLCWVRIVSKIVASVDTRILWCVYRFMYISSSSCSSTALSVWPWLP